MLLTNTRYIATSPLMFIKSLTSISVGYIHAITSVYYVVDSVCTCQSCNHGLARDCLKFRCVCCKDYNHSMVLDGIEGFPPTQNQNKNVIDSN